MSSSSADGRVSLLPQRSQLFERLVLKVFLSQRKYLPLFVEKVRAGQGYRLLKQPPRFHEINRLLHLLHPGIHFMVLCQYPADLTPFLQHVVQSGIKQILLGFAVVAQQR